MEIESPKINQRKYHELAILSKEHNAIIQKDPFGLEYEIWVQGIICLCNSGNKYYYLVDKKSLQRKLEMYFKTSKVMQFYIDYEFANDGSIIIERIY